MKVGFSLSRCMRDIFEQKVRIGEVLVVVSRTDIDPHNDEHWAQIWDGYLYGGMSNAEWAGLEDHEEEMRNILIDLHSSGRLHQPRQFGIHPPRMRYVWLECFAPEEEVASNPTVLKAWEKYKMLAGLTQ